jgi:hypothetical protein
MEYTAKHQMVQPLIVFGGGFYWFQPCWQFFHLQRIVEINFYMTKLQIKGTFHSYSIIKLNEADALFLQNIMERELITYDKIFFERKDFKKLGFSSIEELPIISQINGFLSSFYSLQYPDVFTIFKNNKKIFGCAVDRLETKYHTGMYIDIFNVDSTIYTYEFSFRRKKGCKYYLLKKQQFGTFSIALKDDIDLNQLLFEHKLHHFKLKGIYQDPIQLLEIYLNDSKLIFELDDSKLLFKLMNRNSENKKISICTL